MTILTERPSDDANRQWSRSRARVGSIGIGNLVVVIGVDIRRGKMFAHWIDKLAPVIDCPSASDARTRIRWILYTGRINENDLARIEQRNVARLALGRYYFAARSTSLFPEL